MSNRERVKEIRLCWREDVTHGQEYQLRNRSQWVLETAGSRRDLGTICQAANEVYGEGTQRSIHVNHHPDFCRSEPQDFDELIESSISPAAPEVD